MPDDERDAYLEERFPKLRPGLYRVKSPRDARYNCFAFAANDTQHIWEYTGPGRLGGYSGLRKSKARTLKISSGCTNSWGFKSAKPPSLNLRR